MARIGMQFCSDALTRSEMVREAVQRCSGLWPVQHCTASQVMPLRQAVTLGISIQRLSHWQWGQVKGATLS